MEFPKFILLENKKKSQWILWTTQHCMRRIEGERFDRQLWNLAQTIANVSWAKIFRSFCYLFDKQESQFILLDSPYVTKSQHQFKQWLVYAKYVRQLYRLE